MKIKFSRGLLSYKRSVLFRAIMKTFIFLCCSVAFAVGTTKGAAQNADIIINTNTTLSVKQVFQLINKQTDYKFIYRHDLIKSAPDINLEKGVFKAYELLDQCLAPINFTYEFTDKGTIVVKRKPVNANPKDTKDSSDQAIQFQVSGTVVDDQGAPLPGASIVEKGTTNGTQTDFDGNFSIELENENAVLVVSYIGFSTKEILVSGQANITVVLEESAAGLDEVVVVGYGTQTKKDLTGSVSVIDGDEIESRSVTNVSDALQGSIAGVSVTRSGSSPGSGSSILIRGVTTLQGVSSPLILVDNVPVSSIDDVNPDQIASISVLKDGAAASIYGSRAAAGVIIITTKRAKAGVFSLGYSGEYIVNTPTELPGSVRAVRYMQMDNEKSWNDNGNDANQFPLWSEDQILNYAKYNASNPDQFPDTDWRSLLLKKSSTGYRHNISISGGSDRVRTNVNLGYEYQDALYDHRDWKRYTARINNDIKISDKIGATFDFALKLTSDNRPIIDPTSRAIQAAPVYAPIWSDGRIGESKSGDNAYARIHEGGSWATDSNNFYGMASIYYKPIEALKISLNLAPNFQFNKFKNFNKAIPYWGANDPDQAAVPRYIFGNNLAQTYLIERRTNNNTLTTQALLNYDKTFGDHNLSAVGGYEEFMADYETLGIRANEFVSNDYPFLNQAPIDKIFNDDTDDGTSFSENSYASYFGRLGYNFKNTYYLQATARRDGSSRFGKDYRWGTFPSVSAGWVISNENFMESLNPAISFLKLRASYGSLGNDRLGNYLYQSVLQFNNVLIANGANVDAVRAAAQQFLAIEDVTWETTSSFNFGIDLSMFNNRLSFTGEYFKKETTDMLLALSIPSLSGYDDPTVNVGSMDTNGWELGLTWRDQIGDFKYATSFNIFDSESIIGDIRGKRLFESGDRLLSEAGTEFRSWYGYQADGIFQTQAEVDASAVTSGAVGPGDIKYKDISGPDGIPDGIINELDRTILGGSLPRYQYGGNINLEYKRFNFGLTFQGVGKQKFYLSDYFIRPFQESWLSPATVYADNYWSVYNSAEQNANATYPRLSENASGNNYRFSDKWLLNGAYLRIKNVTLGYTLPGNAFGDTGLSSLRLYISGNDLFTFDNLIKGVDPEQSPGYLITKSFVMGVKANF